MLAARHVDDQVGSQRRLVTGQRRLLDEVAVADHAGGLDDVAQLHLAPLAARVGLAQRGHERAGLGPQPLAGLGQRPQLRLEPPARLTPLLVEREQLGVDPAELLLDRRDELLDRLPALVEIALGLGLGGLQLRPRHLGQLGHARLQRLRAQRLERLAQPPLGVLQRRQALGRPLALMRQVGARLDELAFELAGAVGLHASPRSRGRSATRTRPAPIRTPTMRKRISMGRQALRDRRTDRKNACMSAPPIRLRLLIHGRVQGVFFRDSVRRTATEHGVGGWAENRRRLRRGRARGRARRGRGGRGVLPEGPRTRGRPRRRAEEPARGCAASRSASDAPARRPARLRLRPARPCRPGDHGRAARPR